MKTAIVLLAFTVSVIVDSETASAQWAKPVATVIAEADGYVDIPNAEFIPKKSSTYRAIFDATLAAEKPMQLVPALNMAGSELNLLGAIGVPLRNAKFVVVFHGAAMNGILDETHYNGKFGVSNPNLGVISKLRKSGVKLFVCGQNLAAENIDPKTITPDVAIASDALIVLMTYQNKGYALMSF
jgi:intracellular sulfur oxidation DsrE/DsrF family protein